MNKLLRPRAIFGAPWTVIKILFKLVFFPVVIIMGVLGSIVECILRDDWQPLGELFSWSEGGLLYFFGREYWLDDWD